jgi:hypothetical protein
MTAAGRARQSSVRGMQAQRRLRASQMAASLELGDAGDEVVLQGPRCVCALEVGRLQWRQGGSCSGAVESATKAMMVAAVVEVILCFKLIGRCGVGNEGNDGGSSCGGDSLFPVDGVGPEVNDGGCCGC